MIKDIKRNRLVYVLSTVAMIFMPVFAFAALGGIKNLITAVAGILGDVIPVIFGLAMIYFFWGVSQFILHAGDAKTRDDGKQKMIWGVVALFVMFSIWGIFRFIGDALGIKCTTATPCNIIIPK